MSFTGCFCTTFKVFPFTLLFSILGWLAAWWWLYINFHKQGKQIFIIRFKMFSPIFFISIVINVPFDTGTWKKQYFNSKM